MAKRTLRPEPTYDWRTYCFGTGDLSTEGTAGSYVEARRAAERAGDGPLADAATIRCADGCCHHQGWKAAGVDVERANAQGWIWEES